MLDDEDNNAVDDDEVFKGAKAAQVQAPVAPTPVKSAVQAVMPVEDDDEDEDEDVAAIPVPKKVTTTLPAKKKIIKK